MRLLIPSGVTFESAVSALLLAAACHGLQVPAPEPRQAPPELPPVSFVARVVREMDHVGAPFTQGLEFTDDGKFLIETSGSYPQGTASSVRIVDARTGKVQKKTSQGLDKTTQHGARFVEGITQLRLSPESHYLATTYEDHVAIEYDQNMRQVDAHPFPFMGWGLTRNKDRTAYLATNGSAYVTELSAEGLQFIGSRTVRCLGADVKGLNELEMVDDFLGRGSPVLLGNVFRSRVVLVLDPDTMQCIGALHLEGLGREDRGERLGFHVANGIAYNHRTGHFVVTGKNWDKIYEVTIEEEKPSHGNGRALKLLTEHLNEKRAPPVSVVTPEALSFLEARAGGV